VEDSEGQQPFVPASPSKSPISGRSIETEEPVTDSSNESSAESIGTASNDPQKTSKKVKEAKPPRASRVRKALRSLAGGGSSFNKAFASITPRSTSPAASYNTTAEGITVIVPPLDARRVLYSANAGDARGVLCRAGKAVRLTYDHKGSDKQEAKRITDAGGFVMSGRVNGVLAVTRSLGDSAMKEFVVGAPYTTETELCEEDEFLVLACDGVDLFFYPL